VLPRGAPDGPDFVDAERARQMIDQLLSQSDLVVVATAPIRRSASALAWGCAVNAALVVASREVTRRDNVSQTVRSLRRVGADIAGAVFSVQGGRRPGVNGGARQRRRRGSVAPDAGPAAEPEERATRRKGRPEMVATSLFARTDPSTVASPGRESVEDSGRG
jgi:hypothetical protein